MARFFVLLLIGLIAVPVLAQSSPGGSAFRVETEAALTKIGNGRLTLTWNADEQVLSLDQGGLFAKIALPGFSVSKVLQYALVDQDGRLFERASLILQDCDKTITWSYTLSEQDPFLVATASFTEKTFESGPLTTLAFPKIEIILPASFEQLKSLGTAGLKNVDAHRGSYMFLAVADPETQGGVVAGWLTSHKGSGIVFSEKNAADRPVLAPVVEYGNLLAPTGMDDALAARSEALALSHFDDLRSELFVLGRFDDCRDGLERYADQIARVYKIHLKNPLTGYCTWYADKHGAACNEKDIVTLTTAAAERLKPYGFNFVQIDSHWQSGISKNGEKKNFTQADPKGPYPSGMKKTADMIRSHGLLAGIWVMPFAGSSEDPYWNRDWFVESGVTDELDADGKSKRKFSHIVNREGEPYESFWGGTSLDLTHPEVLDYLFDEVKTIAEDWGYQYFKLDGLWTGMAIEQLYVNNEYRPDDLGQAVFYEPNRTPVEAYREGLKLIRRAAGDDAFLMGCVVSQNMRTLGASFGCVDALRIGPDNGAGWEKLKVGPWHGTNRYFFNGRVWWNDPDPVYVRKSVPLEQARMIASWIAVSGQVFVFSDWLPDLPPERMDVLRRTLRPHGLTTSRPVDLFNEDLPKIWHLTTRPRAASRGDASPVPAREIVALYNWDAERPARIETTPARIGLPEAKEYVAFDFWGNRFIGSFTDKLDVEVPATSCVVLAVRPVEDHPILLSTSQHVTQGIVDVLEERWNPETRTLSGTSRVVAGDDYELRIYDPAKKEIRREVLKSDTTNEAFPWSVAF